MDRNRVRNFITQRRIQEGVPAVCRRQHIDRPAVVREVLGQLERALHTAAAVGGKMIGDQQETSNRWLIPE